jgi:hypothetical protein
MLAVAAGAGIHVHTVRVALLDTRYASFQNRKK